MRELSDILIAWYEEHRRELPWRETTDPYAIWISEIILQQTRVAQGLEYYRRFLQRYPNVVALARSTEEEVLRMWQGLGYYSRARNLYAAAREIDSVYGGVFPTDYDEVRRLPGIGDYTAAAICSFAYGTPVAAVDGNVLRVLSRLFDWEEPIDTSGGRRRYVELAQSLLDRQRPALQNQAWMEFGALQCVPRGADCAGCPLQQHCLAYKNGSVAERPVKQGRTNVLPRYFNYLRIRCGRTLLLGRRTGNDIWRGLYEFPMIETTEPVDFAALTRTPEWRSWFGSVDRYRLTDQTAMPAHHLSHRTIFANFYTIDVEEFPSALSGFVRVEADALGDYAVSRLTELYLERIGIR